jgi:uncharacterized protein YecT (DUF1311 family)
MWKFLLKVIGYGVIVLGIAFVGVIYGYYVFVIKPANKAEITSSPVTSIVETQVAAIQDQSRAEITASSVTSVIEAQVTTNQDEPIEEHFMKEFYTSKSGKLINVMAPCEPGCYVEIDIDGRVMSTTTSGIGWERLYELEDEKDTSVTLNYSQEKGVYIIHSSTNASFNLNGKMEQHPIDYALRNCYSTPFGQTTMGMVSCLRGAEEAWDLELNRIYKQLGGSSNKSLKSAQKAWISFRDAEFNWFNSFFASKEGSKWSYGIGQRRVLVIRQQVEHLQSFHKGY